eukprot:CAMPEP_0184644234 /NCGR_PEP_ID=MMETSP0308-20130426/997_1 /TAXON_ID=38269 /ORGANISM="Gloeochaete witrockiana, Strain SAG 46.84" /LENGTH=304 /DNA_ID=CAMNT_0027072661 /DNA_START=158 /DNA_END=1071 /DNA_ORIENTATION=-
MVASLLGGEDQDPNGMGFDISDLYEAAEDCALVQHEATSEIRKALEKRILPRNDHWHSEDSIVVRNLPLVRHLYYTSTDWCMRQTVAIVFQGDPNVVLSDSEPVASGRSSKYIFHKGFLRLAETVYEDLKNYASDRFPIALSGHGVGGALASIVAVMLLLDGYRVTQLLTFGSPNFVNDAGALFLESRIRLCLRVFSPKDSFPHAVKSPTLIQGGTPFALLSGPKYIFPATDSILKELSSLLKEDDPTNNMSAVRNGPYDMLVSRWVYPQALSIDQYICRLKVKLEEEPINLAAESPQTGNAAG